MGMIEKIKQGQDKRKIKKFLEKKEGYEDLSAYRLDTKQGKSEFLKISFKDIDLEQIKWVFEELSEDEIKSIVNDIDDMTPEQAYYVQAILKDSNIREKYDEQVREYLSKEVYDKPPIEEGKYLIETIHKYRDTMELRTLSRFLGRIDNVDDFIKESNDSMYRYSGDERDIRARLEEMGERCYTKERSEKIGNFMIDNYTEYVNFRQPIPKNSSSSWVNFSEEQNHTILEDMLWSTTYHHPENAEIANALACRYAQRCGEKGLKIEDVAFMKYLTFGDAGRFFLQYKKTIKDKSGAKEVLNEKLKKGLSSKSEDEVIKFASENRLPKNLAKALIIKRIKEPTNKLKMTQAYIDSMSAKDIEDVRKSFTPDEAIDNVDVIEKLEVLIHVKKQQESPTERTKENRALEKLQESQKEQETLSN